MKKTLTLLMLLAMGLMLTSTGQVFADEEPPDEVPEMHDSTGQIVLTTQTVNLSDEEPEAEDDEPEEEPVE